MITWINQLARKLRKKNYFFRRLFDIWTDYLWIDKLVILRFDLDRINSLKKLEKCDVHWSLATVEDCRANFGNEHSPDISLFIKFIQRGDWVLAGRCSEQDSGGTWDCHAACVFQSKPMSDTVEFHVREKEGFILIVFTREDKRGKGLAAGCIAEICRKAKERGVELLYIDISTSNMSSLRAAEKAGASYTDSYYYLFRILKKSYLFPLGALKNRFSRES